MGAPRAVSFVTLQAHLDGAVAAYWADAPNDPAHDIAHLKRVRDLSLSIAADLPDPVDLDLLRAAAMLHDLVNLPKDHPDRTSASRRSAAAARDIMEPLGWGAARLDALAHAITAHSFSARIAPQTLEAQILQDADRLDALGALGIARCFSVSGSLGRALFDPDDPLARTRPLDDTRFALDHFHTKLLHLPDQMHTAPARALAKTRAAVMQDFIATLVSEISPRS